MCSADSRDRPAHVAVPVACEHAIANELQPSLVNIVYPGLRELTRQLPLARFRIIVRWSEPTGSGPEPMQRVRDQDDCERDHRQRDPGLLQPQLAFVGHGPLTCL